MEKAILNVLVGVLILQYVIAAPSDVKLEDIAEVTKEEDNSDPVTLLSTPAEASPSQSPRQKRWFDYYGGFPPFSPNFFNRDNSYIPGGYIQQDPLVQIHHRLQDISNVFKNQPPPPPPLQPHFPQGFPHFPAFIPVIYIPQVGCGCTPDNTTKPQNGNKNTTGPDVENRWPEMEDERQNWGFVTNDTDDNQDNEDDGDGSRPISFDPIRPNRPTSRPPPAVEHGSVQGDVNNVNADTTTTTFRPAAQAPPNTNNPYLPPPTACDSAILKCCLLPQVTYDCFALEGCQNPSSYGYPCENGVISRVIDRFLKYYGQQQG